MLLGVFLIKNNAIIKKGRIEILYRTSDPKLPDEIPIAKATEMVYIKQNKTKGFETIFFKTSNLFLIKIIIVNKRITKLSKAENDITMLFDSQRYGLNRVVQTAGMNFLINPNVLKS